MCSQSPIWYIDAAANGCEARRGDDSGSAALVISPPCGERLKYRGDFGGTLSCKLAAR